MSARNNLQLMFISICACQFTRSWVAEMALIYTIYLNCIYVFKKYTGPNLNNDIQEHDLFQFSSNYKLRRQTIHVFTIQSLYKHSSHSWHYSLHGLLLIRQTQNPTNTWYGFAQMIQLIFPSSTDLWTRWKTSQLISFCSPRIEYDATINCRWQDI